MVMIIVFIIIINFISYSLSYCGNFLKCSQHYLTMANVIYTYWIIQSHLFSDFCDDKEDGFYADPTDPSGYIRCVGGITYFAECPDGLVWVEEELSCDYPQ